jgi:hypothetical protein
MLVNQAKLPRRRYEDSYTLLVTSQDWTPLNETQQANTEYNINHVQTEALRQLVPDSGAYINEVYLPVPQSANGVIADLIIGLLE